VNHENPHRWFERVFQKEVKGIILREQKTPYRKDTEDLKFIVKSFWRCTIVIQCTSNIVLIQIGHTFPPHAQTDDKNQQNASNH